MRPLSTEIINIGDELLAGHTLNTNAYWMSSELRERGIPLLRHTVIPDEKNAILHALGNVLDTSTHILITGGLGPTGDDRTKEILTGYFGGRLVFMEDVYKEIEAFFLARGKTPSPANREQALLPDNAELIINTRGTARGMIFRKNGKTFYVMPGVPYEMQEMMLVSVLPVLEKLPHVKDHELQINTFGLPESEISDMVLKRFPDIENIIDLGFYPSVRGITIRLKGETLQILEEYQSHIRQLLGKAVYSLEGESMAVCILRLCLEKNVTLVTAESCTGGLIASMITDVPGASKVFLRGYVAYSNRSKTDLLGVDPGIIERYGAVSRETVEAMATGALERSKGDIAVAVSGIAGPDGAVEGKPVGTVWISVCHKGQCHSEKISYNRGRLKNKEHAAYAALNLIRLLISDK